MSKRPFLKLNSLPFYFGIQDSPCIADFPHSLPITLVFNRKLGLVTQRPNPKVGQWLQKAYAFSPSLSTPVGEGAFGRERAKDVIDGLLCSIGGKGFKGRTFLEAGCSKGGLLYLLKRRGAAYCLGVDPYLSGGRRYDIEFMQDFFDPARIRKKFDAVFTHGVLEHIQDPLKFLQGLKACAKEGGIIFTAVPNCGPGLAIGDLSLPVHEHYNYFTVQSLYNLYQVAGLQGIRHRKARSGWMLYMWGRVRQKVAVDGRRFGSEEQLFSDYARSYTSIVARIQRMIRRLEAQGARIGIYGANCEFMMFKWRNAPRFFDTDTAKHGKYLPGCSNPIETPQALARRPVDSIWIAPVNHDAAIRNFLENGLKIPKAKVLSMKRFYKSVKDSLR